MEKNTTLRTNAKIMGGFARCSVLLCLLIICGLFVGCAGGKSKRSKPVPWSLEVTKKTSASITVDIIGVNEFNKAAWEGYDLNKYWDPSDRRRGEQINKLTLDSTQLPRDKAYVLEIENEKWQKWLEEDKATELMIIAHLPLDSGASPGSGRIFLPLDKKIWNTKDSGDRIRIQIQETEIRVLTARR